MRPGFTMHVTDVQLKIIAIGLIPVFIFLSSISPKTTTTYILLGMVIITVMAVCYLGMSREKKEAKTDDDLLAVPPKKL
jgi:hypothetical protein